MLDTREVIVEVISQTCDKCGIGEMKPVTDGFGLGIDGENTHRCTACGCVDTYTEVYPYISYRFADTGEEIYRKVLWNRR